MFLNRSEWITVTPDNRLADVNQHTLISWGADSVRLHSTLEHTFE